MKSLIEKLLAAVGLVCASPVLLLLWPLIALTSKGPVIFRQERVGRDRKTFFCYKFRTMAMGTKQAGTHEVSASAVTSIGRILRATKLDELPQLWNILKGEMSFVGPRPCLPSQEELIDEREERGVFSILPGVTGLGQIRGIDMSEPRRLAECDAEYVNSRSPGGDIGIIWKTLTGSGRGDRVSKG
ncbi:MAG: sugar transferase [Verrucomicrobiales bacterium]|nr:sugar transferase [Verrucomicrobiales bacterium]